MQPKRFYSIGTFIALVFTLQIQGYSQPLSVYPGDITDNGIVNNVDFLYMGLAYNYFGPPRDSVVGNGLGFVPQPANPWLNQFANGTNFAFADCNGDGVVNYYYDAFPVYVNYGAARDTGVSPDIFYSGIAGIDPVLRLDESAVPAELHPGETLTIPILLGDAQVPVEDLYGVAFSLYVDPGFIDANEVTFNFTQQSWANPDGDRVYMYKRVSDERVDVSWVRTDHNSVDGFGEIGSVGLIIIIDVIGFEQDFPVRIDSIKMLDHFGNETTVAGDTIMVHVTDNNNQQTGTDAPAGLQPEIWPNPAHDILHIRADFAVEQITLINALGQPVRQFSDPSRVSEVALSGVPPGIYMLEIQGNAGIYTRIIQIQ